jgi:ribosomal protein S18 acetylase RimI-like enzyme
MGAPAGVEAENLNAFHLYEKAGMQCTKRYVDYRRQITVS